MPPLPKRRPYRSALSGTTSSLTDHLAAADAFARLAQHANQLRHLQILLDASLPAHLLPGTRIANFKLGKVIIHADSGAVAVKLRQLAPRLIEGFCQNGGKVTGIEVRVQGRRGLSASPRKKIPKTIGSKPKQALTSLTAGLSESSPIRHALEKLLLNSR